MKNKVISTAWSVIPLAVACVVFVHLFSVSAVTVSVVIGILAVYCALMTLSWEHSGRARQLQINPYSYKGTKGNIFKIAFVFRRPFISVCFFWRCFPFSIIRFGFCSSFPLCFFFACRLL